LVALGGGFFGWATEPASGGRAGGAAGSAPAPGAIVFQAKGCSTCHEGPDSQPLVTGFPSLKDVRSFAGSRREGLSANAYVAESIREPWAFISPAFRSSGGPTTAMPGLTVSDDEVDALVDYLLGS
jgi:cytochrome c551/c552